MQERAILTVLSKWQRFFGRTLSSMTNFAPHKLGSILSDCLTSGFLIVAEDDSGVFGFIAAIKSTPLCSKSTLMATELGWWINEDKRGGKSGYKLINFFESECAKDGVKCINMVHMETSMPEKIKGLYLGMGYSLQESSYSKRVG